MDLARALVLPLRARVSLPLNDHRLTKDLTRRTTVTGKSMAEIGS